MDDHGTSQVSVVKRPLLQKVDKPMQDGEKVRENRVRRRMLQSGYRILKSRQRNNVPNHNNFGDYMVIDATTSHAICGRRFDATLDEFEAFLVRA